MNSIFESSPLYLRQITLMREQVPSFHQYPFDLTAIRSLDQLAFRKPVTFIVGENGTGKSTLLEGLAVAWGFNPEGGSMNFSFSTSATHSELYRYLRLSRGVQRPRDGFFLRAESYYNVATNIEELDAIASPGPKIKESFGGKSLHEQSHGESFLNTFLHRFVGRGMYMMDEPEAALSPLRQMTLLARMHELVNKQSQFIIATHSPILMSYPNAEIWQLNEDGIYRVELEETDHYIITKSFMNDREAMIRTLFEADGD